MLEHEQPEALSALPAAEKRVTSEEFARAVAAIEARKADQAKSLAGTLPIGEGINELGLDASPEEVWAEVEAQRARTQAQRVAAPPQFTYQPKPVAAVAAPQQKPRRHRGWIAIGIFFFLFGLGRHAFFPFLSDLGRHASYTHTPRTASSSAAAPVIRTLQEVPEGHQVYCDTASLRRIIQGADPTKIPVHEEEVPNGWPLIKFKGRVYLRGYTLPTQAENIENAGVYIYHDDNADELDRVPVAKLTVPIKQIHLDDVSGNSDWTELKATHVHLDEHAFEDWSDSD